MACHSTFIMMLWNSPVWVLMSKNVLDVSTTIVENVPSVICALESRRPRDRREVYSSDWDDCLRKFLHLGGNEKIWIRLIKLKLLYGAHLAANWEISTCIEQQEGFKSNELSHRIISSVVDCLRNPRAMRISSVVLCLRIAGAWVGGGGGRAQGDGSLDEQVLELSGDLGPEGPPPGTR